VISAIKSGCVMRKMAFVWMLDAQITGSIARRRKDKYNYSTSCDA